MYVLYFSHYFVSTFINRTSRNCYNTPRNVFSFNFIASYFVKKSFSQVEADIGHPCSGAPATHFSGYAALPQGLFTPKNIFDISNIVFHWRW